MIQTKNKTASNFTPGPWRIQDEGPNSGNVIRLEIIGSNGDVVCEMEDSTLEAAPSMAKKAAKRDEANARLIAAAPELLACLSAILSDREAVNNITIGTARRARAAIAKATA